MKGEQRCSGRKRKSSCAAGSLAHVRAVLRPTPSAGRWAVQQPHSSHPSPPFATSPTGVRGGWAADVLGVGGVGVHGRAQAAPPREVAAAGFPRCCARGCAAGGAGLCAPAGAAGGWVSGGARALGCLCFAIRGQERSRLPCCALLTPFPHPPSPAACCRRSHLSPLAACWLLHRCSACTRAPCSDTPPTIFFCSALSTRHFLVKFSTLNNVIPPRTPAMPTMGWACSMRMRCGMRPPCPSRSSSTASLHWICGGGTVENVMTDTLKALLLPRLESCSASVGGVGWSIFSTSTGLQAPCGRLHLKYNSACID